MAGQIIDIAGEPRRLTLKRGFMIISDAEAELGQVDLDGVLRGGYLTLHPMSISLLLIKIPFLCRRLR